MKNVPDSQTISRPSHARWLTFMVHVEAFFSAPRSYSRAIAWRIRGLRLRSRNGIAALTGKSRHAFRLWMAARELQRFKDLKSGEVPTAFRVVVVVDGLLELNHAAGTIGSIRASSAGATIILLANPDEKALLADREAFTGVLWCDGPAALAEIVAEVDQCWLCVMRPGDRLAPQALPCYAAVAHEDAGIIYADDDLLNAKGERHSPHFKPDWNPELFRHHDYLSGACMIRASPQVLKSVQGPQWWETTVKTVAEDNLGALRHIPHILHHRLERPAPIRPAAQIITSTGELPSVTAIIPTRNQLALLRTCIDGITSNQYPQLRCIVIDNDSDDPDTLAYLQHIGSAGVEIIRHRGPFNFSAMNNDAVLSTEGQLVCFVNNDVEMIGPDWLHHLVLPACRKDVGAVGAKLLYPDRTIQHAGVVIGVGGGAAHAHRCTPDTSTGYFSRPHLPQFITAVTAACMLVERNKFLAVGGFDAENFAVAFNDVDLCLKLNARGWQSFYEPRATLIHHESKSRGSDRSKVNKPRFERELAALKAIWKTDQERDPYHNENLSKFTDQFLIDL